MVAMWRLSSIAVLVAASFSGVDLAPVAPSPSVAGEVPAHAGAGSPALRSGHAPGVAYEVGVVYTYDYSMDLHSVRAGRRAAMDGRVILPPLRVLCAESHG